MKTKTIVMAGIVLFSGLSAKAYNYEHTIRRQEDLASFNKHYAKAEMKMYRTRYKKYKQLAKDLKRYGNAHTRAMQSDAELVGYEAQMTKHGSRPRNNYASDWAVGETSARWREVR